MPEDILQQIIARKRTEVELQKQAVPLQTMLNMAGERLDRTPLSMRAALESSEGIIAEFKRKSPSKGWLFPEADVTEVVPSYQAGGAAACSILTDGTFFGGSLGDLQKARRTATLPLLRKDFVIDPYQLFQARVMGADAVLLIAACLTPEQCRMLADTAHSLQLEVLLEIHSEEELAHLNGSIDMLGVNNRNLGTFHTDVQNSFRLAARMRERAEGEGRKPLLVSESGLSDPQTILLLQQAGFGGFLMGEAFMKTGEPGRALTQLIRHLS